MIFVSSIEKLLRSGLTDQLFVQLTWKINKHVIVTIKNQVVARGRGQLAMVLGTILSCYWLLPVSSVNMHMLSTTLYLRYHY